MTPTELNQLKPGQAYHVKMKGHRWELRIFKHLEERFQSIPCAVFTSRVRKPLTVEVIGKDALRFTGPSVPRGEWSIPHYDLDACQETRL
jgi:hypothetical protein